MFFFTTMLLSKLWCDNVLIGLFSYFISMSM